MSGDKTLLVMRHAKSSWKTNEPDERRPLSGRGTRDAVVAGATLARHHVDVVWCSSATRAEQTWQCALLGGASCDDVRVTRGLYGASADELIDLLRATPRGARTVLVIAHEPGVSDLVARLATASALRDDVEARFPTSAIAALTLDRAWDELWHGDCRLAAFEIPRG